jgi:succinoglycan biosynthesis transport protein ExoP
MEAVQPPVQTIHLSDYWQVITKRKGLVITFACVVIAVTMVISLLMKPVYQATARMSIDQESNSSPITGQRTEYIDVQSQLLTFNTHFKLIKSKPVIASLLKELNLVDGASASATATLVTNPLQAVLVYMQSSVEQLKQNIKLLLNKEQLEPSDQVILDRQIRQLQEQVAIAHERETRLLNIAVEDTDPGLAAQIANLLAQKYIEFDLATRLASENQNMEWLTKEVYSLKKRLEDDERAFFEYKQLNKVFSLEGKQKVIDQKITELNNEFLATRSKRQELDAKLSEIDKQYGGSTDIAYVRSILNNKSIDDIYANLTNLELEISRLGKVFKSKHPKIQQISGEIAKVTAKFNGELSKEIENLKVQHTVLLNREKVMEQTIGEFEGDAMNTNSLELKYTILQRNMDTSQKLYDTLVSKVKESGVVSGGATSNIRIVENASVPIDPIKPNKTKNLLLSIILGVFGGVGLAFFLEYLDQTVRTEEDVQNLLGLPVLGVIPVADKAEKGGYY